MSQNRTFGIGLVLIAACSHATQESGGTSTAPADGIDSVQAVQLAIRAVQSSEGSDSLIVSKYARDKSGFDIELYPVSPPGKIMLGGGGHVRLSKKGKIKSVVLYQ